jgi:hypothetical protein
MPLLFSTMLDFTLVLAGHGDSITGNYRSGGSSNSDDGGGIGMAPIVIVALLAVATAGILIWLNRQEKDPGERAGRRPLNLKAFAPFGFLVAVIAAPLAMWTASSGGDDRTMIVERSTSVKGEPEFLVALVKKDLNKLELTNGKRTVRIECLDRDGSTLAAGEQKWPFVIERGYDYAHAHQPATSEQVQRAARCRLIGTSEKLEADVKGSLQR